MACPKQKTVREINDKIRPQKYGFSGRITKIIDERMMTFYKEWRIGFLFCHSSLEKGEAPLVLL